MPKVQRRFKTLEHFPWNQKVKNYSSAYLKKYKKYGNELFFPDSTVNEIFLTKT